MSPATRKRPGASRGASACPQLRFVSLVENGARVLFGARLGPCAASEIALARQLLAALGNDMLCLAGRNFFSYPLWKQARATGVDLLWRVNKNLPLPLGRRRTNGIDVRVIEYRIEGVTGAGPTTGGTLPRALGNRNGVG